MFARITNERKLINMENYRIKIDGVERFDCGTFRNAATVFEHLTANLADANVELVSPTGETLANPSRHEALAFAVEKGYAVKTDGAATAAPEKAAPVRKVTTRAAAKPAPAKATTRKTTATRATTATGTTPRKKVAAARK